jgi:hypothetical protein
VAHGGGRPIVPSRVTMVTIESDASVSGQSCGGAIVEERVWKSDSARGNEAAATGSPIRLAAQQNVAEQG